MATWHLVGTKTLSVTVEQPTPANPITKWTAAVNPTKVQPGQSAQVTVAVYANKTVKVRATATLFGQTKSHEFSVVAGPSPTTHTFTFVAPSQAGTYTGDVKLEAYY